MVSLEKCMKITGIFQLKNPVLHLKMYQNGGEQREDSGENTVLI